MQANPSTRITKLEIIYLNFVLPQLSINLLQYYRAVLTKTESSQVLLVLLSDAVTGAVFCFPCWFCAYFSLKAYL